MTDSRPEITVRADGAFVVLALIRPMPGGGTSYGGVPVVEEIPLSVSEAIDLSVKFNIEAHRASSFGLADDAREAGPMAVAVTSKGLMAILENHPIIMEAFRNAQQKPPETWRDRESML